MKTLATQIGKNLSRLSALILMSTSALFLTSCQKDELPTVKPQMDQLANHSEVSKKANTTFTMIVIDHASGRTNQPSYKIEIKSNGIVHFTGRKNTSTIGEKELMISSEQIISLKNMFLNNKFSEMESMPLTFDLASATTSFTSDNNMEQVTKVDYLSEAASGKLIELRKATEQAIDISKLIYGRRNINLQASNSDEQN